jgi:DNA-binding beta-propeller fold protein YncE
MEVKQEVESKLGIKPREACVFSGNKAHTEKLQDEETLDSLLVGKRAKLELLLLVEQADAQQVVPELSVEPSMVLGDGTRTVAGFEQYADMQLNKPMGAAFIGAHPDWLVTTERGDPSPSFTPGNHNKISNIRTGALVCKFGEPGEVQRMCPSPERRLWYPMGVAVTSDSSLVIVADCFNHRVQVLRLVVGADGNSAHLEFVRSLGNGLNAIAHYPFLVPGSAEGKLNSPCGVALLQRNGGQQETVLVTESSEDDGEDGNHRVSQFALDGTFVGVFAGTEGSGDGEFNCPRGITVLGSSGEVAVADCDNYRVQIFDSEGNYKRQFGTEGKEADGQLWLPTSLASDAHGNLLVVDYTNRLQVFSPEGEHLCTRSDLGLDDTEKGIAWSTGGEIAVANGNANDMLAWCPA